MLIIFMLLWSSSMQCSISSCNNKSICLIIDFDRFQDLDLNCSINKHSRLYFIKPNYPLILNNNLNLNDLHLSGNNGQYSKIEFSNIHAFELNSSPFQSIQSNGLEIIYQFMNTKFQFYFNNSSIKSLDSEPILFKGFAQSICFSNDVTYYKNVSIAAFKNSFIKSLRLLYLQSSLVSQNYLTFNQNDSVKDLNSCINQLELFVYNLKLTDNILNKHVFKHLKVFQVTNNLVGIQLDLFKSFKEIRVIVLDIKELNFLVHRGLKWLYYLNENINVNLKDENININAADIIYIVFYCLSDTLFTSEDFCLYYDIPFNKLIFPIAFNRNLTCSLIWTLQYYRLYKVPELDHKFLFSAIQSSKSIFKDIDFDSYYNSCNFEKMINNCLIVSKNDQNYTYDYFESSYVRLTKFANYILSIVLLPIVCLCGIFFNILTLITLSNSRFRKDFSFQMFKSVYLNSIFNIMECMIFLFQLMTKCIEPNGIYCSSIRKYLFVQYFHVILISYFGSVFKLCANLSSVSIAFNRFMMITDNKNKLLNIFYNLKARYLVFIIVFISMTLNTLVFLKYKIENREYYYASFYIYTDLVYPFININYFRTKFAYLYLEMVYYFIDSIFCLILILLFDIKLIFNIRHNMVNKTKIFGFKNRKNNIELRTSVMIAMNCILILVSHSLEFLFSLMSILSSLLKRDLFDQTFLRCFDFSDHLCGYFRNDFALFFYFISYSCYFFLYLNFNSRFKLSFENIFLRFKSNGVNNWAIENIITHKKMFK